MVNKLPTDKTGSRGLPRNGTASPGEAWRGSDYEKFLEELEAGLIINKDALDEALQIQPDVFYQISKALASLVSQRDAAKQQLGDVEARVDAKLRQAAAVSEEKITEKVVESNKRLDKDVKAATDTYLELGAYVGQYTALKEAYQMRAYALKDLASLYIAGYFGDAVQSSSQNTLRDHDDGARQAMNQERRRGR